jgi:hypothetical protein
VQLCKRPRRLVVDQAGDLELVLAAVHGRCRTATGS